MSRSNNREFRKSSAAGRPRVAILTNLIPPYRLPLYERLGQKFDVMVLVSRGEGNRPFWDRTAASSSLTVKTSHGVTMRLPIHKHHRTAWDTRYVHIYPGQMLTLLRWRPHAVLTGGLGFGSLVSLAYGAITRRPIWVWWGGTLHTERELDRARKVLRALIAPRVPRWISYGEEATAYLTTSLGVPQGKILQIQNSIDESSFVRWVDPAFRLQPRPVLLAVTQLIARKGVDLLLAAVGRLQQDGREFSTLIVGSGPLEESLREYARTRDLRWIHFAGAVPPEAMPAVYRSADCLVLPTLEDIWGLVVNEALWSGIPALVSRYAGCASEIVPSRNRFDPLDPDDFDRVLRDFLDGRVRPAATSKLVPLLQVADQIAEDVMRRLAGRS